MHKNKWVITFVLLFVIFIGGALSFIPLINHIGQNELYAFAQDKNYCRSQNCAEGVAYVTEALHKQSGIPADDVPWCMAANRIYYADFQFLNALKTKFADWMYQSCERGELTLEDANIQIGEPHPHGDDNGDEN